MNNSNNGLLIIVLYAQDISSCDSTFKTFISPENSEALLFIARKKQKQNYKSVIDSLSFYRLNHG